jgi:hypothetical protein
MDADSIREGRRAKALGLAGFRLVSFGTRIQTCLPGWRCSVPLAEARLNPGAERNKQRAARPSGCGSRQVPSAFASVHPRPPKIRHRNCELQYIVVDETQCSGMAPQIARNFCLPNYLRPCPHRRPRRRLRPRCICAVYGSLIFRKTLSRNSAIMAGGGGQPGNVKSTFVWASKGAKVSITCGRASPRWPLCCPRAPL